MLGLIKSRIQIGKQKTASTAVNLLLTGAVNQI